LQKLSGYEEEHYQKYHKDGKDYGCMGLSHGYGSVPEHIESIRLIRQAYDWGCTFFDTAEGYGEGDNEILVGEALKPIRDKIVLATKFKVDKTEQTSTRESLLEEIQSRVDASLKRLGTDHIDLYCQHRVNKDIPVEDIAWCMGALIHEGKILAWRSPLNPWPQKKCSGRDFFLCLQERLRLELIVL
jgi:aryl-alcohol dehydrogenase-like predicted oxidoreductase